MLRTVQREHAAGGAPRDLAVAVGLHAHRVLVAEFGTRTEIEGDDRLEATRGLDSLEPLESGHIVVTDAAAAVLDRLLEVRRRQGGAGALVIGQDTRAGRAPVFVGRQAERARLADRLQRAREGRGQVVLITGEPGIGKSRVVREFREAIPAGTALVLEGRCAPYGAHVPYFPVLEIVRQACGLGEADPPATARARLREESASLGPAVAAGVAYLEALLDPGTPVPEGRSPEAVKARTFEAIQQMVLAQQARRPLVLIAEDLQWIDRTSEELLASLVDAIAGTRVLLVATARPAYRPPWMGPPHTAQIALGPLSAPDSRRLVESILDDAGAPGRWLDAILARAEGNPFFLEELAQAARGGGEHAALVVPATVHDVVAARIETLPDADRSLLGLAAVIGRDVPLKLLAEAAAQPVERVRTGLARLQAREFVVPARLGLQPEYAFKHALTHEVAYTRVAREQRSALHGRVAAAIEALAPDAGQRQPEVLARHYAEAGRPAEAVAAWHQAAQLALRRSAHADAVAHLGQALDGLARLPESPGKARQELTLQLALATSLTATRGYAAPEVERALARARALTEQLGGTAELFPVRFGLWRFYFGRADFRGAAELADALLSAARRPGGEALRVAAHTAAGVTAFYRGEFGEAVAHLEQGLACDRPGDSAAQTQAYGQDLGVAASGFLAWALAITGPMDAAVTSAEAALRRARAISHPFSLALALLLAAEVGQLQRDAPRVAALGQELLTLSRDHGFAFFTAFGLMLSGWAVTAGAGAGQDGLELMRQGADLFRTVGQRVGLAHRAHLAEALLARGDLDAALEVAAQALQQSDDTGERAFVAEIHRVRAEALARRGGLAEAAASLGDALDLASRQGAWLFALRAACALARLQPRHAPGGGDVLRSLAALVDRFPPAVQTSDLHAARALLEAGR
jgi:predicted ATPase